MSRFKTGDILYDQHYEVVGKLLESGELLLLDQSNDDSATIWPINESLRIATAEEIQNCFNESGTQEDRLFNTPSKLLDN